MLAPSWIDMKANNNNRLRIVFCERGYEVRWVEVLSSFLLLSLLSPDCYSSFPECRILSNGKTIFQSWHQFQNQKPFGESWEQSCKPGKALCALSRRLLNLADLLLTCCWLEAFAVLKWTLCHVGLRGFSVFCCLHSLSLSGCWGENARLVAKLITTNCVWIFSFVNSVYNQHKWKA